MVSGFANALRAMTTVSLLVLASQAAEARALTAKNGMTLYVFDEDHGKKSACYGFCAVEWPPYYAHKGDSAGKGWSIVARSSGWLQWAWRGRLVYFYAPDNKPGDVKGDGVDGTWHIARH